MTRTLLLASGKAHFSAYIDELSEAGCRVVSASGCEEVLRKIRSDLPDLLVLDTRLDGDGFQVLRALKQDSRTDSVSIVLLLSRDAGPAVIQGFQTRSDGCLVEPLAPVVLVDYARHLFGEDREQASTWAVEVGDRRALGRRAACLHQGEVFVAVPVLEVLGVPVPPEAVGLQVSLSPEGATAGRREQEIYLPALSLAHSGWAVAARPEVRSVRLSEAAP